MAAPQIYVVSANFFLTQNRIKLGEKCKPPLVSRFEFISSKHIKLLNIDNY